MEKHFNLTIVLTMIIVFTLTFAYLYRQRIGAPNEPVAPRVGLTPSVARNPSFSASAGPTSQPAQVPAPTTALSPDRSPVRAMPATDSTQSDASDGPPLPVIFTIGTRSVAINDDDGPPRREKQNDGILLNSTDKRIPITVLEVDLPTLQTTQAQLVLQPNGAMHFGEDRGLEMASGHQLTLRAAGYRELTRTIP